MNILQAIADPQLFAPWFRDPATWRAWRVVLRAIFGLPMGRSEGRLFTELTGRSKPPKALVREAWIIVGRRGGKTFIAALVAAFMAAFRDWRPDLQPGERAVVLLLATNREQAQVALRYVAAFFSEVPMLAALVERQTQWELELTNAVTVAVHTNSYRAVRGRTVVCAILDELAFWRDEQSANPDKEVYSAILPSMATVRDPLLIAISSPYRRAGLLYEQWRQHFGKADDGILVVRAASRVLNPSIDQRIVEQALERDPAAAAAEWLAEFRADIESFIDREAVEACVVPGRHELPPVADMHYTAFVDPSGGRNDSMPLGITHRERDVAVLDCLREVRPPFSPEAVTHEFAAVLESYRCTTVTGDRYAGEWPRERFREHGVHYITADKAKSDIYRDALPALNSGKVELLDNKRLVTQLVGLERRTARGGRDSIDHPPGSHDDLVNAAAGALWLVNRQPTRLFDEAVARILADNRNLTRPSPWLQERSDW